MPEGHTIHRLARDHHAWFAGERVAVSSPQGRFAGAERLDGHRFVGAEAWGKHLYHEYDGAAFVHVHLGLFGRFLSHELAGAAPPPARATVRMRIVGAMVATDLVGATTCELVTAGERDAVLARLGPDPIRPDSDPERGWLALRRRRVGIGRALMDQAVLAGVGNVYRAEVLFVHGLHPEVPASEVTRSEWTAMWDTLRRWMRRAVDEQRIITTDPAEIGRPRSRMTRDQALYVYKREHCRRCHRPIRRWELGDRWVYACETCQSPARVPA